MLHIRVCSANIATLSCRRSKRNAAEAEGWGLLLGVPAAARWGGPVGWSRLCPRFAIPGRILMSLRAIKSAH